MARFPVPEFGEARSRKGARPFAFFRAGVEDVAAKRAVLSFEDVYKFHRPDQPTLRDVSFEVERGEFVFITGPSGSGKSTLLQMIYRAETVDEGRILFCGRDVAKLADNSIPYLRRNLGVVFQDFKIVTHWTVFENVALSLEIAEMPKRIVRGRVSEALERVGLAGRGDETAGNLSGGEQQRVAVARAIVSEPALLLADEPTGNLDPHLAIDVLTLFEEINATGTTVLFATHDHTLLEQRPHRILYLDGGRVREARRGLSDYADPDSDASRNVSGRARRNDRHASEETSRSANHVGDDTRGRKTPLRIAG